MQHFTRVFWLSLSLLLLTSNATAQPPVKSPDDILIGGRPLPKVLLVGSMHFAYYGLDAHKTAEENKVDFLSPQKQAEIEELVDYIAQFRPTKIAVESKANTTPILDRYRSYVAGKSTLIANEIDQIAFRLMKRFGLDTLYGVDDWGLAYDMENHKDSLVFRPWLEELFADYDYQSDDPAAQRYREWYDYGDTLTNRQSVLESFQATNSEANIRRGHGAYLVGDFKLGDHRGADAVAINWYSRNLRIFRNIQRIVESPDDRILVVYGAGHLGILTQQFESSPEFELIPFDDPGRGN